MGRAPGRTPLLRADPPDPLFAQSIKRLRHRGRRGPPHIGRLWCFVRVTFQVATSASVPTFFEGCRYGHCHGRRANCALEEQYEGGTAAEKFVFDAAARF